MNAEWAVGLIGLLLLALTAACASTPQGEAPRRDTYTEKGVWVGNSGKYDVRVRIQRDNAAGRGRCNLRVVEMKPAAGLHQRAWGYVRAYDYDCDGRFENLRFRYERDQERASSARQRRELKDELWFAFGRVVPVEKQMP